MPYIVFRQLLKQNCILLSVCVEILLLIIGALSFPMAQEFMNNFIYFTFSGVFKFFNTHIELFSVFVFQDKMLLNNFIA